MNAPRVAFNLECSECHSPWRPDDKRRWRAYLDCDLEIQFFCRECAEREFGSN